MTKRARVGLWIALACLTATIVLVVIRAGEIVIFWKLGTIPRLTIDRVYEEDLFGEGAFGDADEDPFGDADDEDADDWDADDWDADDSTSFDDPDSESVDDPDLWVEFTLTNPGSRPLYYYGRDESPSLGRETREAGGEWELEGESGTGMSFQTIAPGESLQITKILGSADSGTREERFFVSLSLAEDSEAVEIFSETIRVPAEE